jgi:hypothetical protein
MALIAMLTLGCGMSVAIADDTTKTASPQATVVEVSGTGPDVEAAKKDAYREAVRQVVGAYTTSKTRTENDELIEDQIIALSSGLVEDAETLNVGSKDDLVRVRMRCTVRVTKVIDRLKSNKIAVRKVDGQSLGAELLGKTDQEDATDELLREAFGGFPEAWFTAEVDGKPRLGDRTPSGDRELFVKVKLTADLDAYTASATKLAEFLKAVGAPMTTFDVDGSKCTPRRFDIDLAVSELATHLEGAKASDIGFLGLSRGIPESVAESIRSGDSFVFPVKFTSGGKRSHWIACRLSDQQLLQVTPLYEAVKRVTPTLIRAKMLQFKCNTTIQDSANETIANDELTIGAKLPNDGSRVSGGIGVCNRIVAPAWIDDFGNPDTIVLVPQFTVERRFELSEDDIGRIDSISTTVESTDKL